MNSGPGCVTEQWAGGCVWSHGVPAPAVVLPCVVSAAVTAGIGDEALAHPVRVLNAASTAQIWRCVATPSMLPRVGESRSAASVSRHSRGPRKLAHHSHTFAPAVLAQGGYC